jgi:hypothetical protein
LGAPIPTKHGESLASIENFETVSRDKLGWEGNDLVCTSEVNGQLTGWRGRNALHNYGVEQHYVDTRGMLLMPRPARKGRRVSS